MTRLRAKDVEAQLLATNGNMAAVGRALGVRRNTVFGFVARRPELRKLVEQCRETRVDLAESALDRAVARDEPWAVSLVLKTLGKNRGYVPKTEVDIREIDERELDQAIDRELRALAALEARRNLPPDGEAAGGNHERDGHRGPAEGAGGPHSRAGE
jgi:hypothetical protein